MVLLQIFTVFYLRQIYLHHKEQKLSLSLYYKAKPKKKVSVLGRKEKLRDLRTLNLPSMLFYIFIYIYNLFLVYVIKIIRPVRFCQRSTY